MLRQVLRRERSRTDACVVFEQLDFLYIPSTDVAADAAYFTEVLGGRLAFAIDGDGARVAMVEMTEETFEIPQGPCCSFVTPKSQRVALYE